jgi:hypothetical protein
MTEEEKKNTKIDQEGTATHSGWGHFYVLFSKYRDECIKLGQIVLGTNQETSVEYLRQYSSALYSMAQQVFSFYSSEIEKEITKEWLEIVETINERLYFINDREFKQQMISEGKDFIEKEMKLKLILFFNKIDRLAANAGLLVGKERKELNEPKKGLLGF